MTQPYEYNYVHPPVKRWLKANGYEWKYEVNHNGRASKRADFVGTRGDETLVIECKANRKTIRAAVRQVVEYRQLFNATNVAIAMPSEHINSNVVSLCEENDVQLIPIKPMSEVDYLREENPNYEAEMNAFFQRIGLSPLFELGV